jgi:hypothetical protein
LVGFHGIPFARQDGSRESLLCTFLPALFPAIQRAWKVARGAFCSFAA